VQFLIQELKMCSALLLDRPGEWKAIAEQIGNGTSRTGAMVERCATAMRARMKKIGFDLREGSDVEFIPEITFGDTVPRRADGMLEDFVKNRTASATAEAMKTLSLKHLLAA
jgi:hypothetical protein